MDQLLGLFDRNALQCEVEEELRFHVEMQARDYEREGLKPEEALTKAGLRFGDFAQVKGQCVQIGSQNSAGKRSMKALFTVAFFLGVLVRSLGSELSVVQIGNILIAIAILGGLLLVGKRMGAAHFGIERNALCLGLNHDSKSIPVPFDERDRTPVERAQAED